MIKVTFRRKKFILASFFLKGKSPTWQERKLLGWHDRMAEINEVSLPEQVDNKENELGLT